MTHLHVVDAGQRCRPTASSETSPHNLGAEPLARYLIGYHGLVEPPPIAMRAEAHASENSHNGRIIFTLVAMPG